VAAAMTGDTLNMPADGLLIFIDETGVEDYSDSKNPTFGRGGCAAPTADYRMLLKKPWRKLKREYLGGANKPFHATTFEQSRPAVRQITAINRFLQRKFWRFAAMSDSRTALPEGMDGHKAISLVTIQFVRRLVATYDTSSVALVFEASERGDDLVRRDFNLAQMNLTNRVGAPVNTEGCFIEKRYMEAGLEIADLVAHTAGRQRRHQIAGKEGVTKDFEQMYWHSPIPPAFMSIDMVEINALPLGEDDNGQEPSS
jgi:hypothetical protein